MVCSSSGSGSPPSALAFRAASARAWAARSFLSRSSRALRRSSPMPDAGAARAAPAPAFADGTMFEAVSGSIATTVPSKPFGTLSE